jgi:thiamine-monophosphate kinase
MPSGEFEFIRWVRDRTNTDPRVLVGPGDDCAALAPSPRPLLITTDVLTDGVDFHLPQVGGRTVGRKAMAANVSDVAAMAGSPTAAVVGVVLPNASNSRQLAEELYAGLREVADEFHFPIVGGDTNTWSGGLVVSVTLLGEATGRGPVMRSGARPGDWVFVTGPCGGSILGRHQSPKPRVREALALHAAVELHAMIDVSDGLAADLGHILEESRCGAVIDAESVPIHPDAIVLSKTTGKQPLEHALGDGEDFELIFTVSPTDGERLLHERLVPGVAKIGECVEAGLWLVENGVRRPLIPTGWVHPVG